MSYSEEPEREFVSGGVRWKRTGHCCRCGECCRGNPFTGLNGGYCPLFRWVAEREGECADRKHWYYLAGCCEWPSKPEHLLDKPECTYSFSRVD